MYPDHRIIYTYNFQVFGKGRAISELDYGSLKFISFDSKF